MKTVAIALLVGCAVFRPAARSPCPGSEQALSGSPAPYACSQHPRAWTDSPTPRLARRRDTTDPAASARPSDRSSAESRCKSRFLANQGGIIGAGSRSGSFPSRAQAFRGGP